MITLYILSLCIFIGYITITIIRYGILDSVSNSYYWFPYNQKLLFTLFCWGISIPVMILAESPIMFFAGSGITFAGAAAAYQERITHTVHMIGAFSGVILSQISIVIDFHLYILNFIFISISLILILLTKLRIKVHYFWWIEILAYICIMISLLSKL